MAAAGLLLLLGRVGAQVTILTDPSEFLTTLNTIDFEYFPNLTQVQYSLGDLDNQWLSLGVVISDDSPGNGASAYSSTFGVSPTSGTRAVADSANTAGGYIEFGFVLPNTFTPTTVFEAGLWVLNGDAASTVNFFDSGGALLQTITPATDTAFAGLRANQGIAKIRITDGGYYLVDDLQYSTLTAVPEPATVVLLVAGLGLLGLSWWRRPAGC